MLTLYQFPISHYCEKARWALDYKGLEFTRKTLLPGPHVKTAKRLAGASQVPILVDDGKAIQGSAAILDHLEARVPARPLTPADPGLEREARDWEAWLDAEVGVHVRRWMYSVLLDHPDLLIPMFTHEGPWYGPLLYRLIFPRLRKRIIVLLHLNARTARESGERVEAAVERLADRYAGRSYLVGEAFSRADLAAAALLAPLWMPPRYGVPWPATLPPPLQAPVTALRERSGFVARLYQDHR